MKKLVLFNSMKTSALLLLFTFTSTIAFSQNGALAGKHRSPDEIAKMKSDRMKSNLNLTDQQYDKIYAMNLEEAKNRAANNEVSKEQRKERYKAHDDQMKSILTPEQYQKQKEQQANARNKMKDRAKAHKNQKQPATQPSDPMTQPEPPTK